jgi:hypothetical protein
LPKSQGIAGFFFASQSAISRVELVLYRAAIAGETMLKLLGILVIVAGAFLWIGNVSGAFPTFPGCGYIVLLIGFFMFRAGS